MRGFFQFVLLVAVVLLLYRWRYRLLNFMMTIGILRKLAVRLSMNIPEMRSKILPSLFSNDMEG
ncbi:hypothetical protein [Oceanobacillus salinisoli]|uniref:hypothetical protein n=1 Tax=Oceanobacillus salinisoli TaxID=2678611 RepID=UPI0012E177F4|nr:hypothetical protein [Oceanobacillus salinisoli]